MKEVGDAVGSIVESHIALIEEHRVYMKALDHAMEVLWKVASDDYYGNRPSSASSCYDAFTKIKHMIEEANENK